MIKKNNNKK